MGTITISLRDDIEERLREVVKHAYGSSKGGLSKVIENALENYFATLSKTGRVFRALREGAVVAEAETLEELALILRKKGIEPRGLRIVSTSPIKPVVHGGYRVKPTLG